MPTSWLFKGGSWTILGTAHTRPFFMSTYHYCLVKTSHKNSSHHHISDQTWKLIFLLLMCMGSAMYIIPHVSQVPTNCTSALKMRKISLFSSQFRPVRVFVLHFFVIFTFLSHCKFYILGKSSHEVYGIPLTDNSIKWNFIVEKAPWLGIGNEW